MTFGLCALALLGCSGPSSPPVDERPTPCLAVPASRTLVSPYASQLTPDERAAQDILERFLHSEGRDIGNPWALGHTLLALGPDVELDDGRKAVDALFEVYGTWQPGGIVFPKRRGTVRVEPHTDLVLKALTETGVAPDYPVVAEGRSGTVEDLYCASKSRSFVADDTMSYTSNNDIAWSLQGLAAWTPPGATWRGPQRRAMSVDRLTRRAVATYHAETSFLREAREKGTSFQKRKQGIFQYTCGGAHLLQGAAYAVVRGHGEDQDRERLAVAGENLIDRYGVEQAAVEAALEAYPQYELKLRIQKLKFLGHFLETMHKLAAYGMISEDPRMQPTLTMARVELAETIRNIEAKGWLGADLARVRATDEQAYLDLLGDAAHALRGLKLSSGEGSVRI